MTFDPINNGSHVHEESAFQSFNYDYAKTKKQAQTATNVNEQQEEAISNNAALDEEQAQAISEAQVAISELENKIEEISGLTELDEKVNELSDSIDNLSEKLDDDITEVNKKIEEVSNNIPDVTDFATKEEVEDVKNQIPDVTNYASKEEVEDVKNQIPDVSIYATKEELEGVENQIPDVTNYATKEEVEEVANNIPDVSIYATKEALEDVENQIPDESKLATKEEISTKADEKDMLTNSNEISELLARIDSLESKLNDVVKNNVVNINETSEVVDGINEPTKYVVVNGDIKPTEETTSSTKVAINAKSLDITDATISDNTRLNINSEKTTIENTSIEGEFPRNNGGNAIMSINNSDSVIIKDVNVNNEGESNYNCFEIGLNSNKLPKTVVVDNCNFTGKLTNNAVLIFATQNDAVITISNCHFEDISNALRISNRTNATGVTVNIVNCTVDKWESTPEYTGFILFQDYTSTTPEEALENNLFGDNKITVNFINLVYQGEKVTKDYEGQLTYVYYNKGGIITDQDKTPLVNIL